MRIPMSDLATTLRRVPLFTDLSEPELMLISDRVVRRKYAAGTTVFSEGDICKELMVVEEGTIRILKTASTGRQQLIGIERLGILSRKSPSLTKDATLQPRKR
jgi:CRP-like cAMP-binding protein